MWAFTTAHSKVMPSMKSSSLILRHNKIIDSLCSVRCTVLPVPVSAVRGSCAVSGLLRRGGGEAAEADPAGGVPQIDPSVKLYNHGEGPY